ncbi:response regulator [Pseudofulvimonas gallinarii]|jgi:two-component system response regulator|uniref:Two-component system response regulator n=1 Tax=Pseudofulvimonas gallinarii TaxID=634155 RepID=A0A4R3L817_9GAMM|nr:response regulator [Pseudofulvimonas gallinarii]TCS95140.1 two-component system response regulator [Pseudofulvimonas gallinarii]THD13061.1 two-component system response regulator [Pseudofulvimonas gallinarii]
MNPWLHTVLLAEDADLDAELTMDALAEIGLAQHVVHVGDGAEALDWLYRRGRYSDRPAGLPAVALLDLKMPRLDGLQTLEAIRSDPALRHLPVVIFSSSREQRDIERGWALGVNAYVVKPVDVDEFSATIQSLGHFWTELNERAYDC